MSITKEEMLKKLEENEFYRARLLSGSKSFYSEKHPNHVVFFNSNLVDKKLGKIWYGDLDITIDGEKLQAIANDLNTVFYVLSEMDGRFENELKSTKELIKAAQWDTEMFIPIYDSEWKMIEASKKAKAKGKTKKLVSTSTSLIVPNTKIKIKNIKLASTKQTDKYEKEIDIVLRALGHTEALVTDESSIGDFLDIFGDKKSWDAKLKKVSKKLNLQVSMGDLLIDVAKKIKGVK